MRDNQEESLSLFLKLWISKRASTILSTWTKLTPPSLSFNTEIEREKEKRMVVLFNGGGAEGRLFIDEGEKEGEANESFCREQRWERKGKMCRFRAWPRERWAGNLILAPKIDRFDGLYDSLNRLRYLQENLIIGGPAISTPAVNPSLSF